jgi:hypothetical protein
MADKKSTVAQIERLAHAYRSEGASLLVAAPISAVATPHPCRDGG